MHLIWAWLISVAGCALTVQGILRVLYPIVGPYASRKACHMGVTPRKLW